jgi:hypothetical protein
MVHIYALCLSLSLSLTYTHIKVASNSACLHVIEINTAVHRLINVADEGTIHSPTPTDGL